MSGVSSVDPTAEAAAIKARLDALTDGITYNGITQGDELPTDGFGRKLPYRDFEQGSVIKAAGERIVGAGEQAQPHIWGFQVHHFATNRDDAFKLSVETAKALVGWEPSTAAGPIDTVFFTLYDEFSKSGERVGYVRSVFFETTLGQNPDFSLM